MSTASLLMIHNAWTYASGNSKELRKQADDLDVITQASINAYMQEVNITEEELKQMLDNETWIAPQEALEKGFITTIVNEKEVEEVSQSVKKSLMKLILSAKNKENQEDDEDDTTNKDNENNETDKEDNESDKDKKNNEDNEPKEFSMNSFFNAIKNINVK